jgi:hypothetical protein
LGPFEKITFFPPDPLIVYISGTVPFFFVKIILNTTCVPYLPRLTHHYLISHLSNDA